MTSQKWADTIPGKEALLRVKHHQKPPRPKPPFENGPPYGPEQPRNGERQRNRHRPPARENTGPRTTKGSHLRGSLVLLAE